MPTPLRQHPRLAIFSRLLLLLAAVALAPWPTEAAAGPPGTSNAPPRPGPVTAPARLSLEYGPLQSDHVRPGEVITVVLRIRNLAVAGIEASGFQAFIEFDDTVLTWAGGGYTTEPFGQVLVELGALGNQINLAAGIDAFGGQEPTSADAVLARLKFRTDDTIGEFCDLADLVRFRPGEEQLIARADGQPTVPTLTALAPLSLDGIDPEFPDPPQDLTVPSDAGTCAAVLPVVAPVAVDGCTAAPRITIQRDDGVPLDAPFSSFNSPITLTYTATDLAGNRTTTTQRIVVDPLNEVFVDVELPGAVPAPFDRCFTFQFINDQGLPRTVERAITFTDGVAADALLTVSCGIYDCVLVRDPLHTLQRVVSVSVDGTVYRTALLGDDAIVSGDLNDDNVIDVFDFGVLFSQLENDSGDGSVPCGTPPPHADLNGDGQVDELDFAFIESQLLVAGEADCPALGPGGTPPRPRLRVALTDLDPADAESLAAADLNHDGWVDLIDMIIFFGRGG